MQRRRLTTGLMKTGMYIINYQNNNLQFAFRVWNEENRDYEVRRAQMYMVQGFILGNYVLGVKTVVTMVYQ